MYGDIYCTGLPSSLFTSESCGGGGQGGWGGAGGRVVGKGGGGGGGKTNQIRSTPDHISGTKTVTNNKIPFFFVICLFLPMSVFLSAVGPDLALTEN